jgi:hypothetical protein
VEFRGSRLIEEQITRRLHTDLKCYICVEIRSQEATSEYGESYCVCNGELESVYVSDSTVLMVIKKNCNRSVTRASRPSRNHYFLHAYPLHLTLLSKDLTIRFTAKNNLWYNITELIIS